MNSLKTLRPLSAGAALVFAAATLSAATPGAAGGPGERAQDRDPHRAQSGSAEEIAHQAGGLAASKIIGSDIKDTRGESIGEIEDLVVDLQSGRVTGVVVASGGMLGMGRERSVIPPENLHRAAGRDEFVTNLSRERLGGRAGDEAEPRVGGAREPGVRGEQQRAGSARAPGGAEEPRVGATGDAEAAHDADNTGRNRRDREERSLDPLDQGNSRADIEITARIRSALVGNDYLSTNAKNVKIITRGGQVTLRGPVNSEEERRLIFDLASEAAPGRVDNQLEVTRR